MVREQSGGRDGLMDTTYKDNLGRCLHTLLTPVSNLREEGRFTARDYKCEHCKHTLVVRGIKKYTKRRRK